MTTMSPEVSASGASARGASARGSDRDGEASARGRRDDPLMDVWGGSESVNHPGGFHTGFLAIVKEPLCLFGLKQFRLA
jgi:hypothetical protein